MLKAKMGEKWVLTPCMALMEDPEAEGQTEYYKNFLKSVCPKGEVR